MSSKDRCVVVGMRFLSALGSGAACPWALCAHSSSRAPPLPFCLVLVFQEHLVALATSQVP